MIAVGTDLIWRWDPPAALADTVVGHRLSAVSDTVAERRPRLCLRCEGPCECEPVPLYLARVQELVRRTVLERDGRYIGEAA